MKLIRYTSFFLVGVFIGLQMSVWMRFRALVALLVLSSKGILCIFVAMQSSHSLGFSTWLDLVMNIPSTEFSSFLIISLLVWPSLSCQVSRSLTSFLMSAKFVDSSPVFFVWHSK